MDINKLFKEEELIKFINKSGSGHCIYLPVKILRLYGLNLKDKVKIELVKDGILIKKI